VALSFRLGGERKEYVEVHVLRREHPEAADYDDGNWLVARIGLEVGGFEAGYEASIRSEELEGFMRDVRRLHQDLTGEAEFATMEDQLRLHLTADGRGHVSVAGTAQDAAGTGNRLEFHLEVDQTHLAPLIGNLKTVLDEFPVRGTPAA
jgi:hypothetical protein